MLTISIWSHQTQTVELCVWSPKSNIESCDIETIRTDPPSDFFNSSNDFSKSTIGQDVLLKNSGKNFVVRGQDVLF